MRSTIHVLLAGVLVASLPDATLAQEGLGQRIGEQLDRGVERLSEQLRRGWAEIRQSLDELGVQGRVYGRLRWDKALADARIDVQVGNDGVVILTGVVRDEERRQRAVELAEETIGVEEVVSELRLEAPRDEPPSERSP